MRTSSRVPQIHRVFPKTSGGRSGPSKRFQVAGGVLLTSSLYTGVATDEDGKIIPISREKWSWHWKYVTKGRAAGDGGVAKDILRLASDGVLESYLDIANAALQGSCIPDSWKREIMPPIEKVEGTEKVEKH